MSATDPGTVTAGQYAALSRRSAQQGDLRLAGLAAFAGDVHVLESLLWQNGLGEAPDPRAQLAAVGEAVAASIEAAAAGVADGLSDRAVVELARAAMVGTFDESVHDLLVARLASLDHLDATSGLPTAPVTTARGLARLEGRTPDELVAELRTAAADCMAVAHVLATEGESGAALRLARQSDNAAYEACLVRSAVAAGDAGLATVDLRWELAAAVLDGPADGADGLVDPGDLQARRDRLSALLGPSEREALQGCWEPMPPW
jgi:hypothetical protein